jgi:GTPase SAR1 family protein
LKFILFFFLGNKTDRVNQREIPVHIGEEFARRYGMRFLETSAKEADNVERLFMEIAKELTQQARENDIRPRYETELSAGGSAPPSGFTCCKI